MEEQNAALTDLEAIQSWLESINDLDMSEVVADGGITSGMCVQHEARWVRTKLARALAALRPTWPAAGGVLGDWIGRMGMDENEAYRGYQAAVSAIRSWAGGFYDPETQRRLMAVALDLENNRDEILGHTLIAGLPEPNLTGAHLSHCNDGEYVGECKYGDGDCPALATPPQT